MKKGLTLSETLITLAVIGMIMSLTIPTLYRNFSEEMRITSMHKFYTAFNTNIETVLSAGIIGADTDGTGTACDSLSCLRAWGNERENPGQHNGILADTRYFKVHEICKNCFDEGVLPFGSNVGSGNDNSGADMSFSAYLLEDGMEVGVLDFTGNCNEPKMKYNGKDAYVCSIILVDVNGESGPNEPGEDRFAFYLSDEKIGESYLVPFGYSEEDDKKGAYNKEGKINTYIKDSKLAGYNKTAQIMINGWKAKD